MNEVLIFLLCIVSCILGFLYSLLIDYVVKKSKEEKKPKYKDEVLGYLETIESNLNNINRYVCRISSHNYYDYVSKVRG